MKHIALTPFGQRPVTAGLLATRALAETAADQPAIDKWTVLTRLRIARARFCVTDRDLTVLAALLSFLPEREMKGEGTLVVFPSNVSLSDRAYGMAESTLRRHLGALVTAGLILRQDSPNGKRYAARGVGGMIEVAYGFDLRPLLARAAAISAAAHEVESEAAALARARTDVVLRLRDAEKLLAYAVEKGTAGDWAALAEGLAAVRRGLRRRMEAAETAELAASLALAEVQIGAQIEGITALPVVLDTEEMDANVLHSGRHYLNSKTEDSDFEPCQETGRAQGMSDIKPDPVEEESGQAAGLPRLPLQLVLKACPDILPYAGRPISSWGHLIAAADQVRRMMGISPSAWLDARTTMGPATAAVALAGILQRFSDIRSAGGYLRSLTRQASEGRFTPGPMIMALLAARET